MPSLKEVRNRIRSIKSTQQITRAMKMVAASKLRRAQDNILQMRPYAEKLNDILNNVVKASGQSVKSEYAEKREVNRILILVITSDRGLCGAFNSNVFKKVKAAINSDLLEYYEDDRLDILPVGKKSFDFYRKRDFNVIDDYWELFSDLSYEKVKEIAQFAMQSFKSGKYDKVYLVYNEFKNVATQILRMDQFLPVEVAETDEEDSFSLNYIFEPSQIQIITELIPKTLHIQFYKAILESFAAEHGARMTAMDQASENAEDILYDLNIMYNRTRQAVITRELNEIVGGANALSEG